MLTSTLNDVRVQDVFKMAVIQVETSGPMASAIGKALV